MIPVPGKYWSQDVPLSPYEHQILKIVHLSLRQLSGDRTYKISPLLKPQFIRTQVYNRGGK